MNYAGDLLASTRREFGFVIEQVANPMRRRRRPKRHLADPLGSTSCRSLHLDNRR